jgi:hypothetical protein
MLIAANIRGKTSDRFAFGGPELSNDLLIQRSRAGARKLIVLGF